MKRTIQAFSAKRMLSSVGEGRLQYTENTKAGLHQLLTLLISEWPAEKPC